uniref:MGAT4 A/B/C C-terminal domain-containing protein n=1 Tax=Xiphophorus couchianus TaxID=32473 RepID=A0A3B5MY83_9TELE
MRLRNGTVATALIFFTSFLSLSWYTAWQNGKGRFNTTHINGLAEAPYLCLKDGLQTKEKYKRTEDRFYRIGNFEKGVAEGAVDPAFNPVVALRLSVLKDSAVWAILSEVSQLSRSRHVQLFSRCGAPLCLCLLGRITE